MKDIVPASGYYSMARSHLTGAKRIFSTLPTQAEQRTNVCIQFLLGWAAEGYLKAFLCHKGYTVRQLRDIGHNLEEGLTEAMRGGLSFPWIGRSQIVVRHLSKGHSSLYYRYLPSNPDGTEKDFVQVLPELAFDALDALDQAVYPSVQSEMESALAAQGRAPWEWHGTLRPDGWRPG
jgi:hypothetical protein